MHDIMQIVIDLVTIGLVLFGLFFMTVGAIGLVRMPDLFNRMHAATKCVTLGMAGMMISAIIVLPTYAGTDLANTVTTGALVIIFIFIGNQVGANLLAKAAHLDKAPQWEGTLSDELREDRDA